MAKEALVTHAERLVAERGLKGVAVSEIVKAAGQKNNSAVAYHFGSWDGLMDAVWQRHTASINQERSELLAAARRDGSLKELPTLVAMYITPLVSELARNQPSYWARFNEQWLACTPLNVFEPGQGPVERPNPELQGVAALAELLEQIMRRLTQLRRPRRSQRVALMTRFVIGALAAWERDTGSGRQALDDLENELITLAVVLLSAPAPKPLRKGGRVGSRSTNAGVST